MAWPPGAGSAGSAYLASGVTTIAWGTSGITTGNGIVKSIRSEEDVEIIYIENGTGIRVNRQLLWQGRKVDITLVYDTRQPEPTIGSALTVTDPLSNLTFVFIMTGTGASASRKAEGERTITAEYMAGVDGGSGSIATPTVSATSGAYPGAF
jgi:hypothetical protein